MIPTRRLHTPEQAASAVCMLLLLKKYLREAYHLADERIAAFLPSNTAARKAEEKALVTRVSGARTEC